MVWVHLIITLLIFRQHFCHVIEASPISDQYVKRGESFELSVSMDYFRSTFGWSDLIVTLDSKPPKWMNIEEVPKGYIFSLTKPSGWGTYDVFVDKQVAYVTEHNNGFFLYNVSNLHSPSTIGSTNPGGCIDHLYVVRDLVFFLNCVNSLYIYRVGDSYEIVHINTITIDEQYPWGLWVDEDLTYAYIGGNTYFKIYRISNLMNPELVSTSSIIGRDGWKVVVDGNYAFIASALSDWPSCSSGCETGGLDIYDIRDRANPVRVNTTVFISPTGDGSPIYSLQVVNNFLYLVTDIAFHILSLEEDITRPKVISSIYLNFGLSSLRVVQSTCYISSQSQYLYIIDILDPYEPYVAEKLTGLQNGKEKNGLYVKNNVAYAVAHTSRSLAFIGLGGVVFRGLPPEDTKECSKFQITVKGEDSEGHVLSRFDIYVVSDLSTVDCGNNNDDAVDETLEDKEGERYGNGNEGGLAAAIAIVFTTPVVAFVCCCCVCSCSIGTIIIVSSVISLFLLAVIAVCNYLSCCSCCTGCCSMIGIERLARNKLKKKDEKDLVEGLLKESGSMKIAEININKALFEIKYDNLEIKRLIGKGGSNSSIFYAKWKSKDVAFKCFNTSDLFGSDEDFSEFEKEVEVMSSLRHPYILGFFGCTLNPPRVGIVMEYCERGDLKMYILELDDDKDPYSQLTVSERITILYKISDGLEYLHDRNVVHRDVKSENILLNRDLDPKIIDFGVSRIYERMNVGKTKRVGTSFYMAPEVVKSQFYTSSCDIFSFSIVIWEVLSNNFEPYGKNQSGNVSVEYKVSNDENFRPDVTKICDEEMREKYSQVIGMMKKSWSEEPGDRPASFAVVKSVLKHAIDEKERRMDNVGDVFADE